MYIYIYMSSAVSWAHSVRDPVTLRARDFAKLSAGVPMDAFAN